MHRIWTPSLLVHITLDSRNLAQLFQFLKGDPTVGPQVKSLKLTQTPAPSIRDGTERQKALRDRERAYQAAISCAALDDPQIQRLKAKVPIIALKSCSFVSFLDHVRSLILQMLPNLNELVAEGSAGWEFDLQMDLPLVSHPLQNLKSLEITTSKDLSAPGLNATNAIWLLLFLPSLRKASFYILAKQCDRSFIKSNLKSYTGKSKVKELFVSFQFGQGPKYRDSNEVWNSVSKTFVIEKFLMATANLVQFTINVILGNDALNFMSYADMVEFRCLEGLKLSYSTIRLLRLSSLCDTSHETSRWKMSNLKALERQEVDTQVLTLISEPDRSEKLSQTVKEFRLLSSSQVHGNLSAEAFLIPLVKSPTFFPRDFKRIITVEQPMDNQGKDVSLNSRDMQTWAAKIVRLREVCSKRGLELKLLPIREAGEFSEILVSNGRFKRLGSGSRVIDTSFLHFPSYSTCLLFRSVWKRTRIGKTLLLFRERLVIRSVYSSLSSRLRTRLSKRFFFPNATFLA